MDQIADQGFPKDVFGPVTKEEEMHLKLGCALLPKIWGQDGRLLYDQDVPKDVLSFSAYKSLLKSMQTNMEDLLVKGREENEGQ